MERSLCLITRDEQELGENSINRINIPHSNFADIICIIEIIWKYKQGPKHSAKIIKAKCSRSNISKVEETEVTFLTVSDQSYLVFFLKSTSSHFGKLEAFMACTSMSWGCWKLPIRAAQAPLGTGSANEKPANPEAQPLTQNVNTVLSWSNRRRTNICSLWDWGRQGVLFLKCSLNMDPQLGSNWQWSKMRKT